jgi:hypothetical protein
MARVYSGDVMKGLPAGVVVSLLCSAPLLAQERDRSLERIDAALKQPAPIVLGTLPFELDSATKTGLPTKIGPFTFVEPVLRGEFLRVQVPIGEWIMRGIDGVASANRRRKEAKIRRRVESEVRTLMKTQPAPK